MMIHLVVGSIQCQPLYPSSKPRYMHLCNLGCKPFLSSFCTWMWAVHPNVCSMLRFGLWPNQASYGVLSMSAEVGVALMICTSSFTASPHIDAGRWACCSSATVLSMRVWFVHSEMPFCWGMPFVVCSWIIPQCWKC